jgi:peptidoglycan hydrolase-like protein with peptidoglycan-binding domain
MKHCALLTLLLSASIYYIADASPGGRRLIRGVEDPSISGNDRQIVEQYLIEYGYLDSSADAAQRTHNNYEFRRALRQFQRENNITPVNGRITPEIITLINHKTEVQIVLDYLKRYNYIQDYDRRYQIPNAIKWLQRNSGELNVTGVIDSETINFVKSHQRGFAEPIMPQ